MGSSYVGRHPFIGQQPAASGTRTNLSLTVAYVHYDPGPGLGTAVGVRFVAETTDTLDELYVFMDDFIGTLGNITMACDIYNEGATIGLPGATVRDSSTATAMPDGVDKWIKFTFGTPYTPAVGEVLWFVIRNTATIPLTDAPAILLLTNCLVPQKRQAAGYSTTDGFTTSTARITTPAVIKAGANYIGSGVTRRQTALSANNTLERGMLVIPRQRCEVLAVESVGILGTAISGINFYASATVPGGTALANYATGGTNKVTGELMFFHALSPTIVLERGQTYRVTFTFSANSTLGIAAQVEDYASYTTPFDALVDGHFACPMVQDNGAGGWTQSNGNLWDMGLYANAFPGVIGSGLLRGAIG